MSDPTRNELITALDEVCRLAENYSRGNQLSVEVLAVVQPILNAARAR